MVVRLVLSPIPCSNPVLGRYGLVNRILFRLGLRHTRWPGLVERLRLDIGSTKRNYANDIAELFVAARIGGLHLHQSAPVLTQADRLFLPSAAVEMHSCKDMQGFIERSLAAGGWPILQFHGVGGGHRMDCDPAEFRALVEWLANGYRDQVCTIAQGARRIPVLRAGIVGGAKND
jgi:hypothetical protein